MRSRPAMGGVGAASIVIVGQQDDMAAGQRRMIASWASPWRPGRWWSRSGPGPAAGPTSFSPSTRNTSSARSAASSSGRR